MPRYFFDFFEDGELYVDAEGLELRDERAAAEEASAIAAEVGRDHLAGQPRSGLVEVRVRDADGRHVTARSITIQVDGAQLFPSHTDLATGIDLHPPARH